MTEERFARGAYLNTTGVTVNGSLRQRPRILGYVRIEGAGGLNRNSPRVWSIVCLSALLRVCGTGHSISAVLPLNEAPDGLLVVTRTGFPGTFLIGEENWRSDGTFLLSLSEHRDLREAMLLMSASSWIRTAVKTFSPFKLTLETRHGAHLNPTFIFPNQVEKLPTVSLFTDLPVSAT